MGHQSAAMAKWQRIVNLSGLSVLGVPLVLASVYLIDRGDVEGSDTMVTIGRILGVLFAAWILFFMVRIVMILARD